MSIFYAVIALVIIVLVIDLIKDRYHDFTALIIFLGVVVIALYSGGVSMWAYTHDSNVTSQEGSTTLVNAANVTNLEGKGGGTVFGYYGTVEGKRVLYYTVQNEDGGYTLEQSDADYSTIYYIGDKDKPHVDVTTFSGDYRYLAPWLTIDSDHYMNKGREVRLYVPEGTVPEDWAIVSDK